MVDSWEIHVWETYLGQIPSLDDLEKLQRNEVQGNGM